MATELHNLTMQSVDLVDVGANKRRILVRKRKATITKVQPTASAVHVPAPLGGEDNPDPEVPGMGTVQKMLSPELATAIEAFKAGDATDEQKAMLAELLDGIMVEEEIEIEIEDPDAEAAAAAAAEEAMKAEKAANEEAMKAEDLAKAKAKEAEVAKAKAKTAADAAAAAELIAKGATPEIVELIKAAKADREAAKAEREEIQKRLDSEVEQRLVAEHITKAAKFSFLGEPTKAGPILKRLYSGATKEDIAWLEGRFAGISAIEKAAGLFTELGVNGDLTESDDPEAALNAIAKRLLAEKAEGVTNIYKARSMAQQRRPDLVLKINSNTPTKEG